MPALGRDYAEEGRAGAEARRLRLNQGEQRAPRGRKERGVGEGTHRPGRRRVEPGPRVPRLPPKDAGFRGFSPRWGQKPRNRRGGPAGEGVGEVIAGGFLLVVGAVPPVEGCDSRGDARRAGGG